MLIWRISSAGRASALQAGGHRFEPCILHIESLAQLVEQRTFNPWVEGSSPSRLMTLLNAGVAELADALDLGSSVFGRVGSSPTTRICQPHIDIYADLAQLVEHLSCKQGVVRSSRIIGILYFAEVVQW